MKRILAPLTLACVLAASAAQAACYVDYKAKKDNPLRLHYGVMQVGEAACNQGPRAAVVSAFRDNGLNQRRDSAADYFLRF